MERISRYPLKLDPMDMNYLPLTFSRDFINMKPLWSIGTDSNEYFEFEIREKIDDDNKDANLTTMTCYICAIDVPKLFFIDHCRSKRHYINKCIAETALDRMKKHLQYTNDCDITNNGCDTYFCHECVISVPRKDQHSHENLQSHKYLSMFDHLLENFYKIYVNECNTTITQNDSKESYHTDSSKIENINLSCEPNKMLHVENKSQNTDSFKVIRYSIEELKGLDINCNSSESSISKTIKSKANFLLKTNKPATAENELEALPLSVPLDKDFPINEELLSRYIVKDGDKFKCNICYSIFDINGLNIHISGSRHKMNMVSSVHYMMKESGNDLYCIVCCNTLENSVESAWKHCQEPNHTKLYKKILKENGIKKTISQMYCEHCDKAIPKRNEFVHIYSSKQHSKNKSNNTFCSVSDRLIPNNEKNNHDSSDSHKCKLEFQNLENGFEKTDAKITITSPNAAQSTKSHFCVICQVYVPNTVNNLVMHNNGTVHKKKVNEYFKMKNIKDSVTQDFYVKGDPNHEGNTYYCDICNCNIFNNRDTILLHKMGAKHLKKIKELLPPEDLPTSEPVENKSEIICKVCQVTLPNTKNNISEHEKGKKHLNNYKLALESENIVFNDNKHFCQPCNVNIESPLNHIEEKRHKRKNKQYIYRKKVQVDTSLNGELTVPSVDPVTTCKNQPQMLPVIDTLLFQTDLLVEKNLVSDLKTQDQPPSDSSQSQTAEHSALVLDNKSALLNTIDSDNKILCSSGELEKAIKE